MLTQPQLPAPYTKINRLAFGGPMCSGKTYLANWFVDNMNYRKVNFARMLKKTASDLYGVVSKDDAGRKLLQELADDLKKWDPNLFTTHLLCDVADYINEGETHFVLDDLRFQHEFDALKRNGFTVIGVACRDDVRMTRIRHLYPDTDPARFEHASEQGWKTMEFDYWIDCTTEDTANEGLERVLNHVAVQA